MTTVLEKPDDRDASPEEILALLREEASLYDRLQASATRQRSLVKDDDLGPLLALLTDRQKLSIELAGIGAQLAPTRCDWANRRRRFTATQQVEADRLVSDIAGRLRRVLESDEEDARLLRARKQSVAGELRSTHASGEALAAYRAPVGHKACIDQTDEA